VALVPIATWPKDTIEGLAVTASLLTPAPETSIEREAFDALLEKLTVPPVHTSALGAKLTLTSTLCPASKMSGRLTWDMVNSELLTLVPETVTLVCPVFAKVIGKVSVCPTMTLPNRRLVGVQTSCAVAPALTGTMQRSWIAKPIVRRWTVRVKRERMMDWGSRMPPI
jgi:hypothetical protein